MSRRLKKKIRDLCGLENLSKEERLLRAKEILVNTNTKQKLCNMVQGLTHKDIERTMQDIINERQPTESEKEELELRELAPEKFEPVIPALLRPPGVPVRSNKNIRYTTYTREQVAELLAASREPIVYNPPAVEHNYKTYTLEEVQALINGTYNPENFRKK